MINNKRSGRLSPRPLTRIALQIPLPGGTTHPGYLYCTPKVQHIADISKMFNMYYYFPDLSR